MSDANTNHGKRARLRRNVLFGVLTALLLIGLIEGRAMQQCSTSLAAINEWASNNPDVDRGLFSQVAGELISGTPEVIEFNREASKRVYYRWNGVWNSYAFHIELDARGVLTQNAELSVVPERNPVNQNVSQNDSRVPREVLDAFREVRRLRNSGSDEEASVFAPLQPVASLLREIDVSTDSGKPQWLKLELSGVETFSDAVRFRCPLDVPSDLYWILSLPLDEVWYEEPLEWDIVPVEGTMEGFSRDTVSYERNIDIDGVQDGELKTFYFQSFTGARLQPGKEYILWFGIPGEISGEFDVAVTLTPGGPRDDRAGSIEVARRMGIKWKPVPRPEYQAPDDDVVEALMVARSQLKLGNTTACADALHGIADKLPALHVAGNESDTPWNHLVLNQSRLRLDAFRLQSPLSEPADLRWILAGLHADRRLSTVFVAQDGSVGDDSAEPRTISGVDFSRTNLSLGAQCEFRQVTEGLIEPGRNYILVFQSPFGSTASVDCALRASPAGSVPAELNDREFAEAVGVDMFGMFRRPVTPGTTTQTLESPARELVLGMNHEVGVVCDDRGVVSVLDSDTGAVRSVLRSEVPDGFSSVALSAEASVLVTSVDEGAPADSATSTLVVHDLVGARQTRISTDVSVRFLAVSRDGKQVAASAVFSGNDDSGGVVCWDVSSGTELWRSPLGATGYGPLTFGADTETVAVATSEPNQVVWIDTTSETSTAVREFAALRSMSFDTDGRRLLTISETGQVALQTQRGESRILRFLINTVPDATAAAWSSDGTRIAVADQDGCVHMLKAVGFAIEATSSGHEGPVTGVSLTPDAIVSAGADGTIRVCPLSDERIQEASGAVANSIGMKLVRIPRGQFLMGSSQQYIEEATRGQARQEYPRHKVRMTRAFDLGVYEVTVAEFRQFATETGYVTDAERRGYSRFPAEQPDRSVEVEGLSWKNPGYPQADNHPVVHVNFADTVQFCEWLSEREQAVYRMPTEAEWEYACRAGTASQYSIPGEANVERIPGNVADYSMLSLFPESTAIAGWSDGARFTAPVGQSQRNAFGLYDMHGNVNEWCLDWYDPDYYHSDVRLNPTGPAEGVWPMYQTAFSTVYAGVIRGGSFLHHPLWSRSACRFPKDRNRGKSDLGFRVLREVPVPAADQ